MDPLLGGSSCLVYLQASSIPTQLRFTTDGHGRFSGDFRPPLKVLKDLKEGMAQEFDPGRFVQ